MNRETSSFIGVNGGGFVLRNRPHLCYIVSMISRTRTLIHFVGGDLIGSVVRFPLWWYTEGMMALANWFLRELRFRWKSYSFGIWLRNFFVPMYGQYDWSGRLISVIMRFVVLCARAVALVVEAIFYLFGCVAWALLPPLALLLFLLNLYQGTFSLPWFGNR